MSDHQHQHHEFVSVCACGATLESPPSDACDRCGKRPRVESHYGLCCQCIVPFDNECHPEGTDQVYAKGYAAGWQDRWAEYQKGYAHGSEDKAATPAPKEDGR